MVDKVSFSFYVRENFRSFLIHSSEKKSKADNIYHSNYVSINRYLEEFSDNLLNSICRKISGKKYKCEPLTPIILPKTNCLKNSVLSIDNTRLVCVPSVQDRILQKLFIKYLKVHYKEIYNRFCKYDHALNKDIQTKTIDIITNTGQPTKKDIHGIRKALYEVTEYRDKYKYVVKADIVKFFDNINREVAVEKFKKEFIRLKEDNELVTIFKSFVYCDVNLSYGDFKYRRLIADYLSSLEGKGVRQGMPIASLCSSMYLHEFDNLMVKNDVPYIRYADDFLIFSNSYEKADELKGHVQKNLKNIGLYIEKQSGEQKTRIYGFKENFTYLGFDIAYSPKNNAYKKYIPLSVFEKATDRISSYSSMTKVKREHNNYIDFSLYLRTLISGYTNFYNEDLAENGSKFKKDLLKVSEDVRKTLITDNLNIDFDKIGSANKRYFFFGIK